MKEKGAFLPRRPRLHRATIYVMFLSTVVGRFPGVLYLKIQDTCYEIYDKTK